MIDPCLLKNIDSEEKAYLLGWIVGAGTIANDEEIFIDSQDDDEIIEKLRNFISPNITNGSFSIISKEVVKDVTHHLDPTGFPHSIEFKCDFVRGLFDSSGSILNCENGYPICSISSKNISMLKSLSNFSGVKTIITSEKCEWNGVNAIDFLAMLYKNASIYMQKKYEIFVSLVNKQFTNRLPCFRWSRTISDAPKPTKNRFSDSGYDLSLIKKIKVVGCVHYYDTGIQVQPEKGYYFDLVGRSSISKTGWILANSIGIIDNSYTGSIIVALIRTDPAAVELQLPCRLVQIIPRQLILMDAIEVDSLEDTERGEKGFGSSGN
jgi:dUTP pyrophosphatase